MEIHQFRKILQKLPRNAKVLDAGCGEGIVSRYVKSIRPDATIYCLDIKAEVRKKLPKYVRFYKGSIERMIFSKNSFDAILCFHVLEHLGRPEKAISEFHRVLKPNGRLLIEVPHWVSAITPIGYNFYSDPTHKKPFSKGTLKKLLSKKFRIIEIKFDAPVYFYLKHIGGYRKLLNKIGLYKTVVWASAERV